MAAAKTLQPAAGTEERDLLDLVSPELRPLAKIWLPVLQAVIERAVVSALARARRPDGDRGLTIKQVAERLAISTSQVRNLIAQGKLEKLPDR